jgi:hypothetical protein
MNKLFSLKYSMEVIAIFIASGAFLGVLQTFIIGKHFVIPTMILIVAVLFGNLAYYGYKEKRWAKYFLFWFGFILTCYTFFALFWAQKFREILGSSFEYVWAPVVIVIAFLVYHYVKKNELFKSSD